MSLLFSVSFIIWLYSRYIRQLLRPIFTLHHLSLFSPQILIILKYWLSCFFLLGCNIKYLSLIFSPSFSLHPSLCWYYNDWASTLLTCCMFSLYTGWLIKYRHKLTLLKYNNSHTSSCISLCIVEIQNLSMRFITQVPIAFLIISIGGAISCLLPSVSSLF